MKGKRYGFLTFLELTKKIDPQGRKLWKCLCVCGKVIFREGKEARSSKALSCGCKKTLLRKKTSRQESPAQTHGLTKTKFYHIYRGILARCNVPSSQPWRYYGGRGIKCLWKSFEEFRDDMYESYLEHVKEFGEKQTTIDRRNNNGHYSKKNCRWATLTIQARNRRNNTIVKIFDKEMCIGEASQKYGIGDTTLHRRIKHLKMTPEQAVTTPVRKWIRQ